MDFVIDYSDYLVNIQIHEPSRAFKRGMIKLLDGSSLKLFNHDELNRIISGSSRSIDFADLRKHVRYNGYKSQDPTIQMLWKVMDSLSQ
jgi:ubiquitin-protein ligase E3 C